MRIGIVTLHLIDNYGGILQNYALQQALRRLGHEPLTVDYLPRMSAWRYVLSACKTVALWPFPGRRRPFAPCRTRRKPQVQSFLDRHVALTSTVHRYKARTLREYRVEGIVVGSDQVWRPRYNRYLEDMFLRFARRERVRKIVYGASFGVGAMEFTGEQLRRCAPLLRQFSRVSVREASGVDLCREYFRVRAEHVLDPTLLLGRGDYESACKDVPVRTERFLACYILDMPEGLRERVSAVAARLRLRPLYFTAGKDASLTVEEWISVFRDAEYVVTDSFHGTVFSIIFGKPFVTIANRGRGADRFVSLLRQAGLLSRMIPSSDALGEAAVDAPVDWERVYARLSEARAASVRFLRDALG